MACNISFRFLTLLIASAVSFRLRDHKYVASNSEEDMGVSGDINIKYTSRSSLSRTQPTVFFSSSSLHSKNTTQDLLSVTTVHQVNRSWHVQQRPTPAHIQEVKLSNLQNRTNSIDAVVRIEQVNRSGNAQQRSIRARVQKEILSSLQTGTNLINAVARFEEARHSSLLQNATNYFDALDEMIPHDGIAAGNRSGTMTPKDFLLVILSLICLALIACLTCTCIANYSYEMDRRAAIQEESEQSTFSCTETCPSSPSRITHLGSSRPSSTSGSGDHDESSPSSWSRRRHDIKTSWLHILRSVLHLRSSVKE